MKYLFTLISVTVVFSAFAQRPLPAFHSFRDKFLYLDTNRNYFDKPISSLTDSLVTLVQHAKRINDRELDFIVRIFGCEHAAKDPASKTDAVEKELKQIYADAHESQLKYVEAYALQALGDFYGNSKKLQSEAIEQYMAAYDIYKNFNSEEFPARQTYTYSLGGIYYRYEDYENAIKYMQEAR